jgi:hypothetical protein
MAEGIYTGNMGFHPKAKNNSFRKTGFYVRAKKLFRVGEEE